MFIDTSYLLALELKNDQNHQIAQKHWQKLLPILPHLVTTSYVFDEFFLTVVAIIPKQLQWATHF